MTELITCTTVACECEKLHINRPKLDKECKSGRDCKSANCWFRHPEDRIDIKRVNEMCPDGPGHRDPKCVYIHGEFSVPAAFVEGGGRNCKYGNKCTKRGCEFGGHDKPPKPCKDGMECKFKNKRRNPCIWSHELIEGECPGGSNCDRGLCCLYEKHNGIAKKRVSETPCKWGAECTRGDKCWYQHSTVTDVKAATNVKASTDVTGNVSNPAAIPMVSNPAIIPMVSMPPSCNVFAWSDDELDEDEDEEFDGEFDEVVEPVAPTPVQTRHVSKFDRYVDSLGYGVFDEEFDDYVDEPEDADYPPTCGATSRKCKWVVKTVV